MNMISYIVMNSSLSKTDIENMMLHEFKTILSSIQEFKKAEAESLLGDNDGSA